MSTGKIDGKVATLNPDALGDLYEALAAITSPTGFRNLDAGGYGSHGIALAALALAQGPSS